MEERKKGKKVDVDTPRGGDDMGKTPRPMSTSHLEVRRALLGERVQQLAVHARVPAILADALLALERARVEGDGLVPSVRGVVVAIDAICDAMRTELRCDRRCDAMRSTMLGDPIGDAMQISRRHDAATDVMRCDR